MAVRPVVAGSATSLPVSGEAPPCRGAGWCRATARLLMLARRLTAWDGGIKQGDVRSPPQKGRGALRIRSEKWKRKRYEHQDYAARQQRSHDQRCRARRRRVRAAPRQPPRAPALDRLTRGAPAQVVIKYDKDFTLTSWNYAVYRA